MYCQEAVRRVFPASRFSIRFRRNEVKGETPKAQSAKAGALAPNHNEARI